jgi:hypothetical protein
MKKFAFGELVFATSRFGRGTVEAEVVDFPYVELAEHEYVISIGGQLFHAYEWQLSRKPPRLPESVRSIFRVKPRETEPV